MAERRMISKTIVDSDAFLDMPQTTQNLYFHLNIRADDEGFIDSPKKVMRSVGSNQNDLEVLFSKNYIIGFESGVIVIKHWKLHNVIRQDRLKPTLYTEEKRELLEKENGSYTQPKGDVPEMIEKTMRQKAYDKSPLPYSFGYKIVKEFYGKKCPSCNAKMERDKLAGSMLIPTVQHNIPISKGGLHELGNISVICKKCNVSIKDEITEDFNSLEVMEIWDSLTNDGQVTDKRPHSIVEYSIDKYSIDENKKDKYNPSDDLIFFNDSDFQEVWKDYIEVRTKKKASKSDRAIKSIIKSLLTYSQGDKKIAIDIIAKSADSGWTGVFALNGFEQKEPEKKKEVYKSRLTEEEIESFKRTAGIV